MIFVASVAEESFLWLLWLKKAKGSAKKAEQKFSCFKSLEPRASAKGACKKEKAPRFLQVESMLHHGVMSLAAWKPS